MLIVNNYVIFKDMIWQFHDETSYYYNETSQGNQG